MDETNQLTEFTVPLAFDGIARLYGVQAYQRLSQAHVCIVGLGGVGSWIAEALARSGVGKISLVDLDDICQSNINRQLHSLSNTVGQLKIKAMQERLQLINPQLEVRLIEDFLTEKTLEEILSVGYQVVVDAIDGLKSKCLMAQYCYEHKLPLVTVGGAGGIMYPHDIKLCDLNHSYKDKLLMRMRKRLRRNFNFPKTDEAWGIDAVFSPFARQMPTETECELDDESQVQSLKLDCQSGLGTASFVTGSFGFMAAGQVIKRIID